MVPSVRAGGIEKPLRLSRRRAPATGTSTVTSRVSKPAFAARSTSAIEPLAVLPHVELEPVATVRAPAAATSSIDVVPIVESANGMPAAAAAAAPARSPSVCIMRVKPVGAMPNGSSTRSPSTSQPVSTFETSRRIAGWNSMSWNACRARREAELGLGGAVGVVESGLRGAALRDGAQVLDRERRLQAALLRAPGRLLELQQRRAGLWDAGTGA